jgi:uncharacterized FAD-dependent dehydrogenase
MPLEIFVSPEIGFNREALHSYLVAQGHLSPGDPFWLQKRSIDARARVVKIRLSLELGVQEPDIQSYALPHYQCDKAPEVHIIGAGPAGLFAAIACLEQGLKPVILERGKDVRARRRDLVNITRQGLVDENSNYCFGEGGAGTYSDGKLYTRSGKRGDIREVLQLLVAFGADPEILVDAHPHIGTNKLPALIASMRDFIKACGGEIHFETQVSGWACSQDRVDALQLADGRRLPVKAVLLATGHSARDIYYGLHQAGIYIEAKPLAMGVRIEHPQPLIDQLQYKSKTRPACLPPASYSLVEQAAERGVYSFCMCPGGVIAPCATSPGEIVTNGWSPSKRNNPYANAGFVVETRLVDVPAQYGEDALRMLRWQAAIEKAAFVAGGGGQTAPAQRVTDFLQKRVSASLPACSYRPAIQAAALDQVLPAHISSRLQQALLQLNKKQPAYVSQEALLVAPETRTSSPVRIPRHRDNFQHLQLANLYPVGEGAGFAGGIVSAAMDGLAAVRQLQLWHKLR